MFKVFVPGLSSDKKFDPGARYPIFWNVHSEYNEGWRATDALWNWFDANRVEVEDWDMSTQTEEGAKFTFKDEATARLFKLTWCANSAL